MCTQYVKSIYTTQKENADGSEKNITKVLDEVVNRTSSVLKYRVSGVDSVDETKKNLKRILIQQQRSAII